MITKKNNNDSKDNSLDKSDIDISATKAKEEAKEPQQSQPIPEDIIKSAVVSLEKSSSKKGSNINLKANTEDIKEESKYDIIKENTMAPVNYEDFSIITDEIDKKGKKLTLKIIESNSLMKNSIIKISPLGYKESKRKSRDGKIFFGVILEGKNQDEPFMNDFVLPLEESGFGKRHFVVQYSTSLPINRGR